MGNGLEQVPLIEQSHVNAPKVGRMSHQIAVAGFAKGRVAGQVANDRIVLHFAQGYQSRRFPLAYGGDDAGDVVQFLPVFRVVPVADGIGQKFPVFFQGVVSAVEEVLDVVRHDAESGSVPACLAGCRQGK